MSLFANLVRKSFFIPAYKADLKLIRSCSLFNSLPFNVHDNEVKLKRKPFFLHSDVWNLLHKITRQSICNENGNHPNAFVCRVDHFPLLPLNIQTAIF